MEREDFKGPYPYYGAAKIFDYVREYLFDGQFLLLAEDGSVETPDGNPVLQLTDGKFWANNHTHILRGTQRASTEFLYLRLERQPIRGYVTGAAQPKLTQSAINRIPLALPPCDVLRDFNALVQPIFQLRATLLRATSNLRTTRDLLLPKLISGELDVSALPAPETVAA
jgi:type I restriction enzyme S subunit